MIDVKPYRSAANEVSRAPNTVHDRHSNDVYLEPPRGGLPLGVVLGITISVLVALVLGGLTALQLHREGRRELAARNGLLAESLAPVAVEIEQSENLDAIVRHLRSSASAEISRGRSDFNLILRDGSGRVVGSGVAGAATLPVTNSLQARIPVRSPLLAGGRGTLTAWQSDSTFASEMASRRRAAWIDIGITVLAIIICVQLTIYVLVTRPLNHLLTSIHKVEMGYPAVLRQGDIARELRWLAWRFHLMSARLTNSARLLMAAHRRAMDASKSPPGSGIDPRLFDPLELDRSAESAVHDVMRQYIRGRCAQLEACRPGDPWARNLALQIWERDAVEAEKIGEHELRSRAENAALKVFDANAFYRVQRELDSLVDTRAEWCTATEGVIRAALAADGVPLVAIQRRTKHTAGVWRKMREKNLLLEEIHDLLAFRVVVSNQDDCYLALDTIHRLFEPEPFRFKDYIADPKTNGYQSLHTSVRDRNGFVFEVQIRTAEMHRAAEEGFAAHWRYRAGKSIRARRGVANERV